MADEQTTDESQQQSRSNDPQVEAEARRSGWRPKDEFPGDPSVWVDAETFVKRGREIAPHVARQASELRRENGELKTQLTSTQQKLAELESQVTGLTQFRQEMDKQARDRIKAEAIAELKAARESGNVDAEAAAIAKMNTQPPAPPRPEPPPPAPSPQPPTRTQIPQEMIDWTAANPWYGRDPVLVSAMNHIGAEMRANGQLTGMNLTEQLNATAKVVLQRYAPAPARSGGNSVEGGRPSGDGGPKAPQEGTWESLPAHIKAECDAQAKKHGLVGEKKAFKTLDDFRKHYTREYNRYAPGVGYDYRPEGN